MFKQVRRSKEHSAYLSANVSLYITANTSANTSAYVTAYTSAYTSAYVTVKTSANASAYTTAYMGANAGAYVAAYTSANMGANVGAYTDENMGAYMRMADYEDASVDTVKRRLYSSREEQVEIDLLDEKDDSRPMMFRSHSEPILTSATQIAKRPTTLEMDERLATNESFTRRNGLTKFGGLWMTRMTSHTTATSTVTTASTRPKMSLVTMDQRCGSNREGRMTRSAPNPETRDSQEKEVRSGTRRKDDDCSSGDEKGHRRCCVGLTRFQAGGETDKRWNVS
jgi:hypothetical protein